MAGRRAINLAWIALCAAVSAGPGPAGWAEAPADETRTVAILRDGESWFLDWLIEGFLRELDSIVADKYPIETRGSDDCGWDPAVIRASLERALNDPDVDLIYAVGPLLTRMTAHLSESERTRPIFAGTPWFSEAAGFPISDAGASDIPGFGFICSPRRVIADLEALKGLTGATNLHVLIDATLTEHVEEVKASTRLLEEQLGVRLTYLSGGTRADPCLAALPEGIQALYVTILPRMPREEQRLLYAGIRDRGIPNLSMLGHYGVSLGAMAGLAPTREEALARRSALNVHAMLMGVPTAELPVYLPVQDRLMVDQAAARTIGWSIPYDVWLEAEMVNDERLGTGPLLTLDDAMEMAAEQGTETRIAREDRVIAHEDRLLSRGALLPNLDLLGQHQRTETHHGIEPGGPGWVQGGSYGVQLRQVLFNDALVSGHRASVRLADAADSTAESVRLDTMEQAGRAFLNLLSARALYRIERENFSLTRNHLELARLRHDIGAADPTEIYRWQSEADTRQAQLVNREVDMRNAMTALNRVLGVPLDTLWQAADIPLDTDDYYFLGGRIEPYVNDSRTFELFIRYLAAIALTNAPELKSFDRTLEAQGILLRQRRRSYLSPEVAVQSSYAFRPQGTDDMDTETEEEWTVGVTASLPLFEGLARPADIRRQAAVVRQLEAQRDQATRLIEQQALTAAQSTGASHPTIRLTRRALASARKNYDAMLEKYAVGAADILDLLDAQTGLLAQRQQAALAVYQYLSDLVAVQRATAWFAVNRTPAEQDEWIHALDEFIRRHAGDENP